MLKTQKKKTIKTQKKTQKKNTKEKNNKITKTFIVQIDILKIQFVVNHPI
jgi:hypothetical protein